MRIILAQERFPAAFEQLEPIRQLVEKCAEKFEISSLAVYDLIWSITEIATNVIEHGYKGKQGFIDVILSREDRDFIIQVRDQAPIFNLDSAPEPDLTSPLDQRPPGGLGIYITKKVMDAIFHRVTETGGNEITMIKRDSINVLPTEDSKNGNNT